MDMNEKYTFFVVMLVLRIIYFFLLSCTDFLVFEHRKKITNLVKKVASNS